MVKLPVKPLIIALATLYSFTDQEVRTILLGNQDAVWGKPTCLSGQLGSFALLHEPLSLQNVKTFHEAGKTCFYSSLLNIFYSSLNILC